MCRNPFLYSGHFNKRRRKNMRLTSSYWVAIPSFIQGISTIGDPIPKIDTRPLSQSLPLFRAFQHFS